MKSPRNTNTSNPKKSLDPKTILYHIEREFIWDDRVDELLAEYEYLEQGTLLEQAWCFYFNMTGIKYKYKPAPVIIEDNGEREFPPTFYFEELDTYGSLLPTPFNSAQIDTVKKAVIKTNIPVLCLVGLPRMLVYRLLAIKNGKIGERNSYPVCEKSNKKFLEAYNDKIIEEKQWAIDYTNFLISYLSSKIIISRN